MPVQRYVCVCPHICQCVTKESDGRCYLIIHERLFWATHLTHAWVLTRDGNFSLSFTRLVGKPPPPTQNLTSERVKSKEMAQIKSLNNKRTEKAGLNTSQIKLRKAQNYIKQLPN